MASLVPLSEVALDTQYGTAQKANEQGRGIPVLRMGNITDEGAIDLSGLKHVELAARDMERFTVRRGDILFNRTNSPALVGKTAVWAADEPYAYAGYLVRLRLDTDRCDPRFLSHILNTPRMKQQLRARAKPSINMSNLSASELLKFEVPLPAVSQQRRVVEILDHASRLRFKRRTSLGLLDSLTQSIFLDLFGDPETNPKAWPVVTLGDVSSVHGGVQVSASRRDGSISVPYLRVANVHRESLDLAEIKKIHVNEADFRRTRLLAGDVLVVEGHGNPDEIGRCCVWDGSIDPCIHQNHLICARCDSSFALPEYVSAYLNSRGGRRHLLRSSKTTSGLNTISISNVRSSPVMLPPLALQQRFVNRLKALAQMRTQFLASTRRLDELFASLQHRAFSGTL